MTTSGSFDTVEEVKAYLEEVRRNALKHDVKHVLLDELNLTSRQDTYDAYEVSESEHVTHAALAGLKLCCVCRPENFELNRTYETLLINRSLIFKVFLEERDAIEWLTRQPSFRN